MFESALSRLCVFQYPHIERYDRVLYLDCDILIRGDVETLYGLVERRDQLYAAAERADIDHRFWSLGRYTSEQLAAFRKEQRRPFNSGSLLFARSSSIETLFADMLQLARDWSGPIPECNDQPFVNHICHTRDVVNVDALTPRVTCNPFSERALRPEHLVLHFLGGADHHGTKIERMQGYLRGRSLLEETLDMVGRHARASEKNLRAVVRRIFPRRSATG